MSAIDPYINADDGCRWLTCAGCDEPLMEVEGGTRLVEMRTASANHTCQEATR